MRPTGLKIGLTFFISLLTVVGWIGLILLPQVHLITVLLYFGFTFLWIVLSGFAASFFVHHASKNRLTRTIAYVTISLLFICVLTLIYALAL